MKILVLFIFVLVGLCKAADPETGEVRSPFAYQECHGKKCCPHNGGTNHGNYNSLSYLIPVKIIATTAQQESGISHEGMNSIVTCMLSMREPGDGIGTPESRQKSYESITASFVSNDIHSLDI